MIRTTALRLPGGRRSRTALCGYYGLFVLWFLLSGATGDVRTFVTDAAYLPLGAAATALSARAAVRAGPGRDRLVWSLLGVALACRFAGDVAWWWLEAVRHVAPYPSVADVGFMAFYPLLITALACMPVRPQSRRASLGNGLDVLAVVTGGFLVIWYLVLGRAVQAGPGDLEDNLNITYPLWDVLLLMAAGRVVLRGSDPRWTLATRWIVAGAAAFVVSDIGFAHVSALDGFTGGGWLDLPWLGALLCFALAASSPEGVTTARPDAGRHAHLLPLVAVLAACGIMAEVAAGVPLYPVGGVLLANLLITVVVVLRQVVTVTETRALAARYRQAAVTDPLTGLSSRGHFLEQAQAAITRLGDGRCAVAMVDLDHFKAVNDLQGHLAGDLALRAVATHLRTSVRDDDLLARYGGDEFVVLLVDVHREEAAQVLDRVAGRGAVDALGAPISLSVGWAGDGPTLDVLLSRADLALYAAKAAGRGRAVAAHDLLDGPLTGAALPLDGEPAPGAAPAGAATRRRTRT